MKKFLSIVFILIINNNLFSQDILIYGKVDEISNNSKVSIISYKNDEIVAYTDFTNENFKIRIPSSINSGVYRFLISGLKCLNSFNEMLLTYEFDLIINKKEFEIGIFLSCTNNYFPTFVNSGSNEQWYDYKKREKEYLDSIIQNDRDARENIEKLVLLNKNFVDNNSFDSWSRNMAKNLFLINFSSIKPNDSEIFFNYIEKNNSDLLNSPMFVYAIRKFVTDYCASFNNKLVNNQQCNYKDAFDQIIAVFSNSKSKEVSNWVRNYIFKGVLELKDNDLKDYFESKLNNG